MATDNTADKQAIGGVSGAGIFGMKVDGKVPPMGQGLVVSCFIIENEPSIPAMLLILNDLNNLFRSDMALVDGTVLDVKIGTSTEQVKEYSFRVVAVKEGRAPDGSTVLEVLALFNYPEFIYDTKSYVIKGNSQTALQTLSTECGLEFDTDQVTNDVMKWTSVAQSARQFMQTILLHSYAGDESYLSAILDAQGTLILRDLNRQMTRRPQHNLFYNFPAQAGGILVHEVQTQSSSGLNNATHNYGEDIVWNSSDGKTNTLTQLTHIATDPLNVNSEIRDKLASARKTYKENTTDINYHENWVRAEYLNKRHSAAFTETLRILIIGPEHDIQLYDSVNLQAGLVTAVEDQRPDPKLSGQWVVVGRTRVFAENRTSTAYLLSRNSTSVEGTTEIGGGKNNPPTPFETVAATIRSYDFNFNISQMLNELNPIEALASMQEDALTALKEEFKAASDQYGFTELYDKYGEGKDNLLSLMQEFNVARWLSGMCQALNELSKLSLSISIELGDTILQDLASRLDKLDGLGSSFTQQINELIANGDIPDEYLDGVQINQRCVSNKLDDLRRSINDEKPDKCLDAFSIGRLLGPSMNLGQFARELEEYLRDMLCAMGDGTVDGSGEKGYRDGPELDDFLPDGSWTLQR